MKISPTLQVLLITDYCSYWFKESKLLFGLGFAVSCCLIDCGLVAVKVDKDFVNENIFFHFYFKNRFVNKL